MTHRKYISLGIIITYLAVLGWFWLPGLLGYFDSEDDYWAVVVVGILGVPIGFVAFIGAIGPSRNVPRYPSYRCAHCRYLLTGNVTGACPECGHDIVTGEKVA